MFSAYDAKTLEEVWSFNVGSGINAPAISYAVNGKQYVAVLVGSAMRVQVLGNAPELQQFDGLYAVRVRPLGDRSRRGQNGSRRFNDGIDAEPWRPDDAMRPWQQADDWLADDDAQGGHP
jgi:hypothetical protein